MLTSKNHPLNATLMIKLLILFNLYKQIIRYRMAGKFDREFNLMV